MKQGIWNLMAAVFCLTMGTPEFADASEQGTMKGKIMVHHVLPIHIVLSGLIKFRAILPGSTQTLRVLLNRSWVCEVTKDE